jgi:hypothetical protein
LFEIFLIKVLAIPDNFGHFSFFSTKKIPPQGGRGAPQIFFRHKSYFFSELEPHAKFQHPRTPPSGRKVRVAEEREKERKKERKKRK